MVLRLRDIFCFLKNCFTGNFITPYTILCYRKSSTETMAPPIFETNFETFCLVKAEPGDKKTFNLGGRLVKIEKQVSTARYEYFRKYDSAIRQMKPFFQYRTTTGFRKGGFLLYGVPKSGKTAIIMKMCTTDPKIKVFSLRVKDFINGDAKAFFNIAREHGPAVIVIEDLDELIHTDGKAKHLKEELFHEISKVHKLCMRNPVMVAAESRFPHLLNNVQLDRIFRHRFYLPLVGVKMREEWPKPQLWRDNKYFLTLRRFQESTEFLMKQRLEAKQKRVPFKKQLLRFFCIGE